MGTARAEPRAVVVLTHLGREVVLIADAPERRDLELVDDLARLLLLAGRFGWDLRVTEVRDDLLELLELAGLAGLVDPSAANGTREVPRSPEQPSGAAG